VISDPEAWHSTCVRGEHRGPRGLGEGISSPRATAPPMPSMAHEALVDLFKNRPELGPELLTEALGVALPSYDEARLVSIDLTQIRPAEYRADVVVLLLDAGASISVVIVEVQLAVDDDKRFTWPGYTMGARARYRCPAGLLVV